MIYPITCVHTNHLAERELVGPETELIQLVIIMEFYVTGLSQIFVEQYTSGLRIPLRRYQLS